MIVLAGDIGGTHARLALFDVRPEARPVPRRRETFESAKHDGLSAVVLRFLSGLPQGERAPEAACFALACPVTEGVCRLPNVGWEVDGEALEREVGIERVRLLNDFNAVGHGLALLEEEELHVLQEGRPMEGAPLALIGAGTGLGHAHLTQDGGRYRVHASEGGHADFAPRSRLECELLDYLAERHGRVSWERVVSGPGLVDLYRFLRDTGRGEERPSIREAMEAGDAAAAISRAAMEGGDELCARALDLFTSAYGAQAGNLALTVRAEGGLYVAGGIAPDILPKLRDGTFMEAFLAKGRLSYLVARIPVRVILNEDVGLLGAAVVATAQARRRRAARPDAGRR